jgi:hypothetical protein
MKHCSNVMKNWSNEMKTWPTLMVNCSNVMKNWVEFDENLIKFGEKLIKFGKKLGRIWWKIDQIWPNLMKNEIRPVILIRVSHGWIWMSTTVTRLGRIFTHWTLTGFGQFFVNYWRWPAIFLLLFPRLRLHKHFSRFFHKHIWWTMDQSYDRELQRQRCKNLLLHKYIP